jgi:heme/copper-type cytochrome/quinol oxidase subunit 2
MKPSRRFSLLRPALLLAWTGWPAAQAWACATCYGAPGDPMTNGLNMGILTLLGVTGLVLGGCAWFMISLARRARHHAQLEAELDQILRETKI